MLKRTLLRQTRALIALASPLLAAVSTLAQNQDLLAASDAAWTHTWKAAYGCSYDAGASGRNGDTLRQTLPANFPKGDYAWSRIVHIEAGARYRFRVLYKAKDVKQAFAQLHFIYPNGDFTYNDQMRFPTATGTLDQWTELTAEFVAPAWLSSAQVSLQLNSPGTIWWDAPSLVKIASPKDITFSEDDQHYDLRDSVGLVVRGIPVDKIAPLNIHWVRYNINWNFTEKDGPGLWDEAYLSHAVEQIAAAKTAGIHTMVSLGYAPRWAARSTKDVKLDRFIAKDMRDWENYVAVIVGRLGDLVDCYRIMNEVNHQWDTGPQPREYTRFLNSACKIIKTIRPGATVLMAGLSCTPVDYLQGIYDASVGKAFDVAACQPYIQARQSPETGHLAERLQAYRLVMAANGDNSPIWGTEFGYPGEPFYHITQEEQAGLYVRAHLLALSSGAGVTKFFFYLLRDGDTGDSTTKTGGLYTRDWKIKPVGTAIATLARVINPVRRYVGEVRPDKDPAIYDRLFAYDNGDYVWALWHPEGTSNITLKFSQPVEQIRWDGVSEGVAPSHSVQLNHLPVYFVGKMPDIAAKAVKPKNINFASSEAAINKNIVTIPWIHNLKAASISDGASMALKGQRNPRSGVIARARVSASAEGLSVQADIDDSSPALNSCKGYNGVWAQDSVEVYVNTRPENSPAGFVTGDCYHFIATPGVRGEGARLYWADQGVRSVQKVIADARVTVDLRPDGSGYRMSFFIPWKAWTDNTPKQGDLLGFDIQATRADAGGRRDETGVWQGTLENGQDASLWGTIRLGESQP